MTGALRLCAASLVAAFTITCAQAAEPTPIPPPPPEPPAPTFFVHLGALGIFTVDNASSTGGGFFNTVEPILTGPLAGLPGPLATISNVTARPMYTLGYELGYYITPNWSISLFSGVPPILRVKAEGLAVLPNVPGIDHGLLGTPVLASERWGPLTLLFEYHFTQFGAIQPYIGLGAAYITSFGHINDGILRNSFIDNDWTFAATAGADIMLTPNLGMFVSLVKLWYETDAGGFLLNTNIPIRTRVVTDPWFPMVGLTFKY